MQEFDPRRLATPLAPRLAAVAVGLATVGLGWLLIGVVHTSHRVISPTPAIASAPVAIAPTKVAVRLEAGETLAGAVGRLGVDASESRQVAGVLGKALDARRIKPGLAFDAAVMHPRDLHAPPRLISLSVRTGPASALILSRAADGAFALNRRDEPLRDEKAIAQGVVENSLVQSVEAAGTPPGVTLSMVKLMAHKFDFSRDLHPGDRFRLVFDRKVTRDGQVVADGDIDYAEISTGGRLTRLYRFQRPGGRVAGYFDQDGKSLDGFLLRTPVYGAPVTSGFGMRLHPILGYTRMHQGIDFGVPVGTPVLAAGDGVVEQARWAGGYGRLIKLRHAGGWETAYAHLSRWAARRGQHVRQGQVIAYSGASGEATGPHVHFEVIEHGVHINPKSAKAPSTALLEGAELAAFESERGRLDALLIQSPSVSRRVAAINTLTPAATSIPPRVDLIR